MNYCSRDGTLLIRKKPIIYFKSMIEISEKVFFRSLSHLKKKVKTHR